MEDGTAIRLLAELGMDELSYKALPLLPLVQVAWADGEVQEAERGVILDLAAERFQVGEEGLRLLRNWLRYRPTPAYLAKGREALLAVVAREKAHGLGDDVLGDVVKLSRTVAKAAGGLFGIGAVSRVESDAIDEIAKALQLGPATPLARAESGATAAPPAPGRRRVTLTLAATTTLDVGASAGVLEPSAALGGGKIPVDRSGLTIGTDPTAGLQVADDPGVDPMHCRIYEENRKFYVSDLDSASGTFVDGERVSERRLLGGEVLRVGEVELTFKMLRRIPKQML